MNSKLAICIPTYNRAKKLDACVRSLIPQLERYGIPIYISDNASTDETELIAAGLKDVYPFLFYSRNESNLGADRNFQLVLGYPDTEYSWLLSDDDLILEKGIDAVMALLDGSPCDLLVVNAIQGHSGDPLAPIRIRTTLPSVYTDRNMALTDLGWHTTWISCLVLSKRIAKNGDFDRYIGTHFVHFGTIFDALARNEIVVKWVQTPLVCFAEGAVAGYSESNICELFAKHWAKIVLSLPEGYPLSSKKACIKNHSLHVGIFSATWFLSARVKGHVGLEVFKSYRNDFKFAATTNLFLIILFCATPRWLCKIVETCYRYVYPKLARVSGS